MHEAEIESRPRTAQSEVFPSPRRRAGLSGQEPSRVVPAWMLPPRLGVLRRPGGDPDSAILRLVVPVPVRELDEGSFERLVWQLAAAADADVLLLANVGQAPEELPIRRRLATLAAFLQRPQGRVETAIRHERSWTAALRREVRAGDLVVCPARETRHDGKTSAALADQVVTDLHLPAYELEDFRWPEDSQPRFRLGRAFAWAAPLAMLAGFAGLQVQIVIQTLGWLQTILLVTTVGVELALLLLVERLVAPWR